MNQSYIDSVRLLLDAAPAVFKGGAFALKGGTAINLFVRNLPRLSVDRSLAFSPGSPGRIVRVCRRTGQLKTGQLKTGQPHAPRRVFYIGCPQDRIDAVPPDYAARPSESFKLVYIGSMSTSYDLETLVAALARPELRGTGVELHFAGQGDREPRLQAQARAHRVNVVPRSEATTRPDAQQTGPH